LCQAIFVIGASAGDLLQPLRPRRLLAPVIVAGFMMAILVLGLCLSVGVLFGATAQYPLTAGDFYLLVAGGAWVFCSIFFFTRARQWERYKVLRNLTAVVLAASLLEVLATGLSFHIISYSPVPRGKGGYIVSVIVIIVGVCVMLWAIGPAILLLFLRERRRVQGIGNREMGEQGQRG
jgi:uncharacterized membrane protein